MEYTPYFDTLRKTRLLRGMTDAELTLLMESLAPRVRRYDKGELLLMAGYETKDVGIILEGEITATKPMPDVRPSRWPAWGRAACLPMCWQAAAAKVRST